LVKKEKWRRAQNFSKCHQTLLNEVGGVWARDYWQQSTCTESHDSNVLIKVTKTKDYSN